MKESKPINTSNLREDNKLEESSEPNATAAGKIPNATNEVSQAINENVTVQPIGEKPAKNVSAVFRNIDERKIQSDTKDIEDESGNNILQARRVITAVPMPTIPPNRSTLINTISNTSGNVSTLDDVQTLSADTAVRKRHRRRRRQGK